MYSTFVPKSDSSLKDVYALFASIKTTKEAEMLLSDILTPQELHSVAERWKLIRMLDEGRPQREIAKKLKLSISKITRGSHAMQYGSGGFRYFLKKLKPKKRR